MNNIERETKYPIKTILSNFKILYNVYHPDTTASRISSAM